MKKLLNTKEASDQLKDMGVSYTPGTLEVMRCQGRGPSYRKVGRRIYYTHHSLFNFISGVTIKTVDSLEGDRVEEVSAK